MQLVGDLELSRCAVFKALDKMPSLGYGVRPRSGSPTLLEVSCLSLQGARQLSLSGFGRLLRLSFVGSSKASEHQSSACGGSAPMLRMKRDIPTVMLTRVSIMS